MSTSNHYRAYQSREAGTVRGKFGGTASYPAEYAVKDQQGLIVARFDSMPEAESYAAQRNISITHNGTKVPATIKDTTIEAEGTLLIDLGLGLTVSDLLNARDDLNDFILEEPYQAGYRVNVA